ncbi:sodium channel and clathrin linker 1-like isoform X2 [Tubulanus polymorphus]|uniref:sodium channel and clathrin linker 1-like isoform X2 n=1 Tax=Tubulanus polymorphus TaxID=672921 RepID=UPI003DA3DC2B
MANEEISFLRDQVKRLNASLAQYQEKYPPLTLDEKTRLPLNSDGPTAPWLVDKGLLSPLLLQYDSHIKSLTDELQMYKSDQQSLRSQIEKLVAENRRLATDMREVVQTQLEDFSAVDLAPVNVGDDHMLENLQQQLDIAVQEKQVQAEMAHSAMHEIERLEKELREQKSSPQWKLFEQQANQIKEQYFSAVSSLNNEISKLQDELRKSKNSERTANVQVTELRRTLEDMKTELHNMERSRDEALSNCGSNEALTAELKALLTDVQRKLQGAMREIEEEKNTRTTAEKTIPELQKRCTEYEQREYEAMIQVRDSAQLVENIIHEKDQCLISEKQKEEEIIKLQDTINKLVDEAGIRTKEEVENVRRQYNTNIEKLTEEIYRLEMENTEKQVQMERAVREKKSIEAELEKIYREGLVKGTKEASVFDELNSRMFSAERERDELRIKHEALENKQKRAEIAQKQEKSFYEAETDKLKDRISTLNTEFENLSEDRLKYLEEIDELKRKLIEVQTDREAAERKFNKQVAFLEQDKVLKERELEVRLQSTDDAHRHGMLEIRKLLSAHQKMAAKWKEECRSITQKFEDKVLDLRAEISRLKARNKELTDILQDNRDKSKQSEDMLSEYSRNIRKLEERVREAEQKAAVAAKQVSLQIARERKAFNEKRRHQREADRNRFDLSSRTTEAHSMYRQDETRSPPLIIDSFAKQ